MGEMKHWHYAIAGQQYGPVPFETLQQLVTMGQLGPGDLLWHQGMPQWMPARQLPRLVWPAAWGNVNDPLGQLAAAATDPSAGPTTTDAYGRPFAMHATARRGESHSGTALASMIVALVGLVFCGVVAGIVAICLSVSASSGMQRSGNYEGRGYATAGLVIGILECVGTIIVMMVIFASMP